MYCAIVAAMKNVKTLCVLATLALGSVHAHAQDDTGSDPFAEGLDLMQQGTRLLMQAIIAEFGPAWAELEDMIANLNAYHPPEVLPNGDIIIRRKVPLAPEAEDDLEL